MCIIKSLGYFTGDCAGSALNVGIKLPHYTGAVVDGVGQGVSGVLGFFCCKCFTGITDLPKNATNIVRLAGDTVSGVLGTAASILTVGKVKKFNKTAYMTNEAQYILPKIVRSIAHVLNTHVEDAPYWEPARGPCGKVMNLFSLAHRFALDADFVSENGEVVPKGKPLNNYLFSRMAYVAAGLLAIISRVVDAVIGLFSGIGIIVYSLLATPSKSWLRFTDECLSFNLVGDLCRASRGLVNPRQTDLADRVTKNAVIKYLKDKCDLAEYNYYDVSSMENNESVVDYTQVID